MPRAYRRVVVANSIRKKYVFVDVFCIKENGQPKKEIFQGISLNRLPIIYNTRDSLSLQFIKYLVFIVLCFFQTLKYAIKKPYDIIHVHNPPDFLILGAIPFKLAFKTRIILDLHDMFPEVISSNLNIQSTHFLVKIAELIEKISILFSDAIICTNNYDKEIILSRNRISPDDVFVVMNSPDLDIMPVKSVPKSTFGLENRFIILFEGTIWKRRGIQTVIDAIDLLKQDLPVTFCIVGDGPYLHELQEYVREKKLESHIHFTGWVNLDTLSEYISVSDVCIIPFLNTQVNNRGVPNKLFEYIVHDKTILSSSLKGIFSTFSEEEITFFEPGNIEDLAIKIQWCYDNPRAVQIKRIKAKNRYYAEYTWDRMENELYRCYEKVMQKGRS
ncbi:MAG: glycosyltransferase family 4 protein [Methanospirillum sp.]|uniref:glycosyltransferase family 4 protein n=1 Tax=Methanospirillum sp. TaxID=45200 RepID=UPI002374BAEF|nr:glycosyltransferase family 4 protein [Methanospirillum sp.]MDD1730357.1 glycosyltransferase family 4 protein [Methanospirillum sp.]